MTDIGKRAFEGLDERLQHHLQHTLGWAGFRPMQQRALGSILEGKRDVVISAPTAGGKTEAAFLPLLSKLSQAPGPPGLVLCVSPLKALIRDQTDRLTPLAYAVEVPVTAWHGDAPRAGKKKFLRAPHGLLIITPESLEAILVRMGSAIVDIVAHLEAVVVDELHAFIGTDRGKQLQSQLRRVDVLLGRSVPRIALSATLGDIKMAAEYLRPGAGEQAVCIEERGSGRELQLLIQGYRRSAPAPTGEGVGAARPTGDLREIAEELFLVLRGTDNLVFANSRAKVELLADLLRRMSELARVPNEFLPHHGSLSKELRELAERVLKDKRSPATILATVTLEMGIDVGSVRCVVQFGNAPSVSSMQQRKGRSGRTEGEPARLRNLIVENDSPAAGPQDALRAQMVQSVAMVELMLEGWLEPPDLGSLNLSTLIQQLLSLIAQCGGAQAAEAWSVLCQEGPFSLPDKASFMELLRALGKEDLLTQTGDGLLVLGLQGERIVEHFEFYAAFFAPREFKLVHGGRPLGSLPVTKPVSRSSYLIFGGLRWEVLQVDRKTNTITVQPSLGGRAPMFDGGVADVHDGVRLRMREVYMGSSVPAYLDATARDLLQEGRAAFRAYGLETRAIIPSAGSCQLFPWCGDRVLNTIERLLGQNGVRVTNEGVSLRVACSEPELREVVLRMLHDGLPTGAQLAEGVANKRVGKYDDFLPERLLT